MTDRGKPPRPRLRLVRVDGRPPPVPRRKRTRNVVGFSAAWRREKRAAREAAKSKPKEEE